jgi:nucleoside-diphosphate-sugar epimerase
VLIAVTGASGFVGGRTVRELVRRGHRVLGYGRRAACDMPPGAVYTAWDFTRASLVYLPDMPDAVVHCAGSVTDWGSYAALHGPNVLGTLAVLDTFKSSRRFVHISTASVYDPRTPKRLVTEQAEYPTRYLNAYARTKMEAECAVRTSGRPAIVLRPHAVYGPGDRTLLPRLLAARRLGWLPVVGNGRNRVSVTHVDNLVQAIVRCVEGEVDAGVFNIADARVAPLDTLLRTLLRRLGMPARIVYIPKSVAAPLAGVLEWLYQRANVRYAPLLTPYVVSQLAHEYTLDISRAQRELGYAPRVTFASGPL